MSPPPGKSGGAVSGAGPCALATEAKSDNRTRANTKDRPRPLAFRYPIIFLPAESNVPRHTHPRSRETTGRLTRCEEVRTPLFGKLAARGNARSGRLLGNISRAMH